LERWERWKFLTVFAILWVSLVPALCVAAACSHGHAYDCSPYYGATLSLPVVPKDPRLYGYQIMLHYDPQKITWRQFNVYFDGGFSYFRSRMTHHDRAIDIYSAAPTIRYTFKKRGDFLPFLEFGIGVAYLNHIHFANRNLGMHFAFQDRLGCGALFGPHGQFILGIHAVHYSNANLAKHNSGISIPIVLDLGYRFLG
jgi:hypothetical protein